ncbi:MAG: flavodoxin family protein [Candidatus Omnitrophota bacterium]
MKKKMIILSASPVKNGNTACLVRWFAEGVKNRGAEVKIVDIARIKYKVNGCISCQKCQESDKFRCVIDDAATPVIASLAEKDMIVFATPLYFFGPTAQLKLFLDRMYSLVKLKHKLGMQNALKNKKMVLLASAAGSLTPGLVLLEKTFSTIAAVTRMKFSSLLIPKAGGSGDIRNNKDIRKRTVRFSQEVL